MLNKIGLAAALVCIGALPALAQAACTAPSAPAVPDPASATVDQVRASLTAAQAFMAASDTYQDCLAKDLAAQKAAATKEKPMDPAVEKDMEAKADANQGMKQQVATAVNGTVNDFKKAHSCSGQPLAACK